MGDSLYEVLDQNAYVNPNAEWVNRKGKRGSRDLWLFADIENALIRSLDHASYTNIGRQNVPRHRPWHVSAGQLDVC